MKRKLISLSLLLLSITSFSSCYSTKDLVDNNIELEDKVELKILSQFAKDNNYEDLSMISISEYYGEYNGAYVVLISDTNCIPFSGTHYDMIGDFVFKDGYNTRAISVYKDGSIYDFSYAYDNNFFTQEEFGKICNKYIEYNANHYTYYEYNQTTMDGIVDAYCIQNDIEDKNQVIIKDYYGRFTKSYSHVVLIEDLSKTDTNPYITNIDDYSFVMAHEGINIYVFDEFGYIEKLSNYGKQDLNENDISKIHYIHDNNSVFNLETINGYKKMSLNGFYTTYSLIVYDDKYTQIISGKFHSSYEELIEIFGETIKETIGEGIFEDYYILVNKKVSKSSLELLSIYKNATINNENINIEMLNINSYSLVGMAEINNVCDFILIPKEEISLNNEEYTLNIQNIKYIIK